MLSSTRPSPGLPSSSSVSAAGLFRVSGSRRPKQAADRPLRQNTVKGMEVWRARCDTHRHTTRTFYCLNPQPVCLHSEYLHTLIRRFKSEIKT